MKLMKVATGVVGLAATGAAAVYLLDPAEGSKRRARLGGLLPLSGDRSESGGPSSSTLDLAPRPGIDPIPEGETNDPTLVARVESELFRDAALPKGEINIDAANGVVTLRGTLDDAALADGIVNRVGAIDGVIRVVDLLHRR